MPLVAESENSQTTVIGTVHQLAAPTTSKARLLRVDLSPLAAGEQVNLRVQTKVRAAGTVRDQLYSCYVGPPGTSVIETIPVCADLGATFTLTQLNGSPRVIDWKVLTFDTPLAIESENTLTGSSTETTLGTASTTNKTRVLRLDLSALAAGDAVAVRVKTKVRTAGTIRDQYYVTYTGLLGTAIVETVPLSSDLGATFTITQFVGTTGKAIDWKILTLD